MEKEFIPYEQALELKKLGFDWLSNTPSFEEFLFLVSKTRKTRPICKFLMDQTKTAGIGNYILAEVLYASKIHPFAQCGDIEDKLWKILYDCIIDIMNAFRYTPIT